MIAKCYLNLSKLDLAEKTALNNLKKHENIGIEQKIENFNILETIYTKKDKKNDKKLKFDYLMCISSYDIGDKKTYGVAYNFKSTSLKHYLEVRIEVDCEVEIPSIANLWRTANWHEREAFDLMGIYFIGHPDLRRVLLPEGFAGHPLRKDYVYEIHEEEW